MMPEVVTALSVSGVALISAVGTVATTVVGRRQPSAQRRRDDFAVVTRRMEGEIRRQGKRLDEQQDQLTGQGAAISWLVTDRRQLVSRIRRSGLDLPPARPIPERARPFLDGIDV